jgi:hypothetical protein
VSVHDPGRGVRSEPTDVPFGIALTVDGQERQLSFEKLSTGPLRVQLRDACLSVMADRGGTIKSLLTARNYLQAIEALDRALAAHGASSEPGSLDVSALSVTDVHEAFFGPAVAKGGPAQPGTIYARRILHAAADCAGNDELAVYLRNMRLYGYTAGSGRDPYTPAELRAVIGDCKRRLHQLDQRRTVALKLLGLPPAADDTLAVETGRKYLATHPVNKRDETWWVAHVIVHGFTDEPDWDRDRLPLFRRACEAFFPSIDDAYAAMLLVVNEFGSELQKLISMRIGDVSRDPNNSSVMELAGVKARADRAVSRRGNAVSHWSGGRILERWMIHTAAARRWTGTDLLWQYHSLYFASSDKTLRAPIKRFLPDRPVMLTGGVDRTIEVGDGTRVRLSPARMRKSWTQRAEKAHGHAVRGPIDPNHSGAVSWAFYRGAAFDQDQRRELLARAHDDLLAIAASAGIVIDSTDPAQIQAALRKVGVSPEVIAALGAGRVADSGTTLCQDPKRAPGQAVGTMCRQTPFFCLVCRNAVHTRAHLPVLIALDESVSKDRANLPAEEYLAKWAGVDIALQHVLGRFSRASLQEARKELDDARGRIGKLREAFG